MSMGAVIKHLDIYRITKLTLIRMENNIIVLLQEVSFKQVRECPLSSESGYIEMVKVCVLCGWRFSHWIDIVLETPYSYSDTVNREL